MVNGNIPDSYPFTYTFDEGTQVTLEAVQTMGYRFNNWSGDLTGTTNPTTITMNCNTRVIANFSFNWYVVVGIIVSIGLIGFLLTVYSSRQA